MALKFNLRNVMTHRALGMVRSYGLLIRKIKIKFLIYRVMVIVFMTIKLMKPLKKLKSICLLKT
jgi:hypothetical protein